MNIPLNIDWQQILLHLFNFLLLFAILYFLLYKPVKAFMDKREKYYDDIDNEANKKLSDAEKLKAEYEEKLNEAEKEIASKREEALKQLEADSAEQTEKAKKQAAEIISKAASDAERERERIIAEANGEISEMVSSAAEKLVFESTSQAFDKFLDEAEGSADDE